jgi:hypothetical protein
MVGCSRAQARERSDREITTYAKDFTTYSFFGKMRNGENLSSV